MSYHVARPLTLTLRETRLRHEEVGLVPDLPVTGRVEWEGLRPEESVGNGGGRLPDIIYICLLASCQCQASRYNVIVPVPFLGRSGYGRGLGT